VFSDRQQLDVQLVSRYSIVTEMPNEKARIHTNY